MGHKKYAGRVTEQTIGGAAFLRVDVPELKGQSGATFPAFTKLLGASSIYAITPTTEETARGFGQLLQARAFNTYEAPRLPAIGHDDNHIDYDGYDDDDDDES